MVVYFLKRKSMRLLKIIILLLLFLLLFAFIVPATPCISDKNQRDVTCNTMESISSSLKIFKHDNGTYPTTEEGLEALFTNPNIKKYPNYPAKSYFQKMPKDTWRNEIVYLQKGDGFTLISYASDRKEGGEGWDKDILYPRCEKE